MPNRPRSCPTTTSNAGRMSISALPLPLFSSLVSLFVSVKLWRHRCINETLAIELLGELFQFLPLDCHSNFEQFNDEALSDTIRIVVQRRFHLRYVCLLWHNVVHRAAHLVLQKSDSFMLYDGDKICLSKEREDTELLKSSLRNECQTERQSIWNSIQSVSVSSFHRDRADDSSLLRILTDATADLTQPCGLDLVLDAFDLDGVRSMVKDPDANFSKLFPTLTLRHLRLDMPPFLKEETDDDAVYFENIRRCTNYTLNVGTQTLSSLAIDLTALDTMLEGWVCQSLQELRLGLFPLNFKEAWREDDVRNEVAKHGRIPHTFPQLESLTLYTSEWPHVDFTVLSEMERLTKLRIDAPRKSQCDWRLCSLPNIACLDFCWHQNVFPMRLSEFVPNVKHLTFTVSHTNACTALQGELSSGFQQLSDLSLKFDHGPPSEDSIALFVVLHRLPALRSLTYALHLDQNTKCCPPGDFRLMQVLPGSLRRASLSYCLLPAPVTRNPDGIKFVFNQNIPNAEEAIYKTWFRNAVLLLCDLPNLERFYCRICAPSFHAAILLAAKWSKSSSAATADFGLANVINISCSTKAYLNIEPGQRYGYSDTLKFRFTLSARPGLAKKKFSTRIFTFELECMQWYNQDT